MKSVAIIGGGVVGLCSAYFLAKSGHKVCVFEASEIGKGCSYGNAGIIVPSHFETLSSPGIIRQGLKWMLNPNSPFFLKPRLDLDLLKWIIKFNSFCTHSHVEKNRHFLKDLNLYSKDLYEQIRKEMEFDFSKSGLLMVCKTEKYLKDEEILVNEAKKLGLEADILNKDQIKELEPNASFDVLGGSFFKCDAKIQPYDFMKGLKELLVKNGVEFFEGLKIENIHTENGKIKHISDEKQEAYVFDEYVLSMGIFTTKMMKNLHINLPMEGGKGFSFKVKKNEALNFKTPMILVEEKVSVTPYDSYVRFGGTMMICGYDTSLNQRRIENIKNGANNYIDGLKVENQDMYDVWAGLRPCGPDGLPYVGRLEKISNAIVATGHAMMGVSLGPATGKIVNDLVEEKDMKIDINRLNPQRFN